MAFLLVVLQAPPHKVGAKKKKKGTPHGNVHLKRGPGTPRDDVHLPPGESKTPPQIIAKSWNRPELLDLALKKPGPKPGEAGEGRRRIERRRGRRGKMVDFRRGPFKQKEGIFVKPSLSGGRSFFFCIFSKRAGFLALEAWFWVDHPTRF